MSPCSNLAEVCLSGLAYGGFPLAEAFAKDLNFRSFNTDNGKVKKLTRRNCNHHSTCGDYPIAVFKSDFVIKFLPTLLAERKELDLSCTQQTVVITGQNINNLKENRKE